MEDKNKHLVLFLTWDVSLKIWRDKGLLQREIKLYQALAEQGVQVTFLSWGDSEDIEIGKSACPEINIIPIYDYIPRPKCQALRALSSLLVLWKLRHVFRKADILKTNQMWGAWVAALTALFSKKPLIVRCGFELYDFTLKQGHGKLRQWLVWLTSALTYGMGRHVCVATPEDKLFVMKTFGVPEGKISIHPNWIDTSFFKPIDVAQKDDHVLFVGRLTKQKNLFMLIEALKNTDFTLDIIGDGELKTRLTEFVAEQGAKVNFLGSVPNDQLPEIYNRYPVFVLPSFYEGNPKTLLEAMACGSAVVGTQVSGIASVIEDTRTGLLAHLSKDDIRKKIETLMSDIELRDRLGAMAREQIKETQTLDKLIDKELACYRKVCDES